MKFLNKSFLISCFAASALFAGTTNMTLSNDSVTTSLIDGATSPIVPIADTAITLDSGSATVTYGKAVNGDLYRADIATDGTISYSKKAGGYGAAADFEAIADADVPAAVLEKLGATLKAGSFYFVKPTGEDLTFNYRFARTTLLDSILAGDDIDGDGIANADDYCPFTEGVAGTILEDTSANSKTRGLRAIGLLEVDSNGIPSIPAAGDTTVTSSGTDLVISLVMDGANSVFVAKYGASLDAITESATFEGMAVTVPSTAKYVQIISDGGTVTFEVN